MTKDEIIKKLRDMAKYPTVTLPRDCEALKAAADLLAQRTWVGLTWEDANEIAIEHDVRPSTVKAIEAKLKEKNT